MTEDDDSVWAAVQTDPQSLQYYPIGEHEDGDSVELRMETAFKSAVKSKHAPVEAEVCDPMSGDRYLLAPSSTHLLSDLAEIDPQPGDRIRISLEQDGGRMDRIWSAELVK
jgi:hypothetical protein